MPKASKEFGYSNRHIRRLRNQQTKLEIKILSHHNVDGKSNDDHEELNVNYNKNFEKPEEGIYDGAISNDDNFSIDNDDDDDDQMNFSSVSDSETEYFNFDETNNFKEESMHTNYFDMTSIESGEDSEYSTDCDLKNKEFDFNLSDSDSDRNNNTSPSSSESEEDEGEEEKCQLDKNKLFKSALRNWAILYNIPLVIITALLLFLSQFTTYVLPQTARTLIKTPINSEPIITMSDGGEYMHFGLKRALDLIIKKQISRGNKVSEINLFINIDGLPIYKASKNALWLIMGSEVESEDVYLI